MADEPMARVPKMARGKITLARGIHCCPRFYLFILPDKHLYIAKNACTHTTDSKVTVYELPLLPNITASETNRKLCEV